MKKILHRFETMLGLLPQWMQSNWAILALYTAVVFIALSSVLIFHVTTFFTNLDNVNQFYTWYQKLAVDVHHGFLPIWDTNVFGGQSFAGELQPGVFYPINILWTLLFGSVHGISQQALDYLVALHFVIASFGAYLLTKQLGARKWSAFVGGLIFAFSGMVAFRSISQTVIFFGLALMPFPIYFLAKYHAQAKANWWWLIACGASLGLILLSGHIDPFYFALLILGIFELTYVCKRYTTISSLRRQLFKSFVSFCIIGISSAIIALPQLVISAGYLPHAYRIQAVGYAGPGEKISYRDFSKSFNLDIHEAANIVDPVSYQTRDGNSLFIGLVPLGVLILTLCFAKVRLNKTKIWAEHSNFATTLLLLSTVVMLGYVTWFAVLLYEIPGVYQIRELGRYTILFHFGMIFLLVAALEVFAEIKLTKRQKLKTFAVGAFLWIDTAYLLLLRHRIFSLHNALQIGLLSLLLLFVSVMDSEPVKKLGIITLVIFTVFTNTLWFLPNITPKTETPAEYSRMPSKLVALLEQTNGSYRVDIPTNAIPVNTGNVYNVQTMGGYAATVYAPYYEVLHKSAVDPGFVRDIFGVKLVVQKEKPSAGQTSVYEDMNNQVYIVSRPSALPKFFMTLQPGSLVRSDYQPITSTTLSYNDHLEKYSVTMPTNGTAIISEIAYRGWTATIDGMNADLKTYEVAGKPLLKSLDLSAGTHIVELSYKPFGLF